MRTILSSSLVKASGVYTISSVINASIPFLLLPVLTNKLDQADFGIVSIYGALVSFILPFISVNMEGAIARRYYSDKENISRYIGNCLMISLLSFFGVFAVLSVFLNSLFKLTTIPSLWIILGALYCLTQFTITVLLTTYQVSVKPVKYGLVQITQSIMNFGLSVIFVVMLGLKWQGRLGAQLISSVLFAIISLVLLITGKFLIFKPDTGDIKNALKFGSGLIPHAIGGSLILLSNRFFLLKMVSIEEAGLYGVASQIATVISFFTLSFNNAYVPWLFKNLSKNDEAVKRKIVKLTYSYFLVILVFGTLFYLILPVVFSFFVNPKFAESLKFCFWIIMGFVFQGMYFMVTNYISYSEKTYFQAAVTISIGIISIASNYFFIHLLGSIGAAVSFCFSYILMFIMTWIISNRIYPMPWFRSTNLR